ncbi:MAG: hypothetical protein WDZ28_03105 [Simkaniaceae bacterium]
MSKPLSHLVGQLISNCNELDPQNPYKLEKKTHTFYDSLNKDLKTKFTSIYKKKVKELQIETLYHEIRECQNLLGSRGNFILDLPLQIDLLYKNTLHFNNQITAAYNAKLNTLISSSKKHMWSYLILKGDNQNLLKECSFKEKVLNDMQSVHKLLVEEFIYPDETELHFPSDFFTISQLNRFKEKYSWEDVALERIHDFYLDWILDHAVEAYGPKKVLEWQDLFPDYFSKEIVKQIRVYLQLCGQIGHCRNSNKYGKLTDKFKKKINLKHLEWKRSYDEIKEEGIFNEIKQHLGNDYAV